MNILPKKRWHVRTKENIERVRRDEENAAQEEKERLRRIALAESEARTEQLRDKARKRNRNEDIVHEDRDIVPSTSGTGHINFFEDIEKGEKLKKTNDEYEKEKKEEKEKQEKAIGLLTYLGQSAVEGQTSKPWYFSPPKKKKKTSEEEKQSLKEEFDLKSKMRHDPMVDMMKYMDTSEKVKDQKKSSQSEKRHKHKKHKRDRKDEDGKSKSNGPKSVEQLRAERLKREQEERRRTQELLARVHGHIKPQTEEETDERKRGYNSQFNPSLARKWKPQNSSNEYE